MFTFALVRACLCVGLCCCARAVVCARVPRASCLVCLVLVLVAGSCVCPCCASRAWLCVRVRAADGLSVVGVGAGLGVGCRALRLAPVAPGGGVRGARVIRAGGCMGALRGVRPMDALCAVGCDVAQGCRFDRYPPTPPPSPPCRGYCPPGCVRVRVRAGRGLMGPVWLRVVVVSVVLTASVASVWLTEPQGVHCVEALQRV